tara:strand:- start:664 stop:1098 length:435 start_codon:yes stop_codon:yes gene_type:complete
MVECNPQLINSLRDTLTIRITDTIVTKGVSTSFDGVLVGFDTLVNVDTKGVKTRIVRRQNDTIRINDTIRSIKRVPIYIETECPPEKVFIDVIKKIPCPDPIVVVDMDQTQKRAIKITWAGIGMVGGMLLFALFAWAIGKIRGN